MRSWKYGIGGAATAALVGAAGAACDDTQRVTPAQSSRDAGSSGGGGQMAIDGGPGGALAVDATDPGGAQSPDAALCMPAAIVEPAAPDSRCEPVPTPGGVDPFLGVPCGPTLEMPGLTGPVQVVFTEMGVPHVYAAHLEDAIRVQGYLVARDRFFQMDLTRRNTLGLLSGYLSQLALSTDIENRTFGQALSASKVYDEASDAQMKGYFDAYAAGVNFYIDRVADGLDARPEEYFVLGDIITDQSTAQLMPHWTGRDVAAGAAAITYALAFDGEDLGRTLSRSRDWGGDLPQPDLRRTAARTDVQGDLRPITRVAQTVVGALKPGVGPAPAAEGQSVRIPAGLRPMAERLQARLDRRKPDVDTGSNTWAVDAAHGRDGVAYLASDPHLSLGAATFFYQIHLDTRLLNPTEDDVIQAAGVTLPGTPFVVIGHTDRIAWGITNLNADDTDFYLEEVALADGRPESTSGPTGTAIIRAVREVYEVTAAPLAGFPEAQRCAIDRYETADGRMLVSLEGTPVEGDVACERPPAGAVNIAGEWLVPGDMDGDGKVTGISVDFTGLDANPVAMTVEGFLRARNIDDFMQAQRHSGVFNNAQAVADVDGNIATTGFHGVPRRAYLRDPAGGWADGGDPTLLIDGTRFPSFEVTIDDEFRVVTESDDAREQMISFEDWPRLVRPERGFVVSANNDLAGGTFDGDTGNEETYVGWNFDIGFRAQRITDRLTELTAAGQPVGYAEMESVQNDHHSNLAGHVLRRLLSDLPEAGCPHAQAADAVERLAAWQARGLEAASGVETFYHPTVEPEERLDAVATMIFNDWFAFVIAQVLNDEQLEGVHWNGGQTDGRARLVVSMLMAPEGMGGFDPATADHVYWDDAATEPVETRSDLLCRALGAALDHLGGADGGGFGTADASQWLWGLRHTVNFPHTFEPILGDNDTLGPLVAGLSISPATVPVAACAADDDPRNALPGFPRPGDNFCVDASTAGWNPADFGYDSGPVQRLIVRMEAGRVRGELILPGGQSGHSESANWADQARLWLGNERRPIHFQPEDVAAHARERLILMPPPP